MCLFAVEPINQLWCVTSDVVTVQILTLGVIKNSDNTKSIII